MADGSAAFRPWTPRRRTKPLGLLPFLWVSWRDPLGMWSERHFREPQLHGDSALGEILVVSHPEGVRHVLSANAANYEKGALQRRVLGPMLADGLLLTEGEAWRRVRRILAPLFTPARTATMTGRMADRSRRRVDGWRLDLGPRVLNLDTEMSGLTFDILSATLFSDQLDGDAGGFEKALDSYLSLAARIDPLDVLAAPDWIPRLGRVTGAGAGRFFERRVSALVARRRAQIGAGEPVADDLLTALLNARDEEGGEGLSDHEVASNVLTFILAGHETTARTLGWTLHLVSRTPDVAARLSAEADAFDAGVDDWAERLPWTRAVIEEAMRLFPPAPTLARRALGPDEVGGQKIKAGATVLISPWVLHRHESLWDAPDAFRPERFLPENRKSIDRWSWIPFSAGPRVCIGATFAMNEAMVALATILKSADVEPIESSEPRPVHQITLRSARPIRLRLRARA
ncbi:MAG TPA: cytochrome P450 [Brevundimonas sp.]|jgi:cytochrome P450|uniref:cytochrome P450 n=1 Tax=Brevundimonas sp. TaxID=1871086 RepID=UPI002DED8510|nr:cytochrome P450 [Brevundimonas sp.]